MVGMLQPAAAGFDPGRASGGPVRVIARRGGAGAATWSRPLLLAAEWAVCAPTCGPWDTRRCASRIIISGGCRGTCCWPPSRLRWRPLVPPSPSTHRAVVGRRGVVRAVPAERPVRGHRSDSPADEHPDGHAAWHRVVRHPAHLRLVRAGRIRLLRGRARTRWVGRSPAAHGPVGRGRCNCACMPRAPSVCSSAGSPTSTVGPWSPNLGSPRRCPLMR